MESTLFEKLVGTWTLVELIEVPVNGQFPVGDSQTDLEERLKLI